MTASATSAKADLKEKTAYDFSFQKLDGSGEINLSDYQGKVVIVVNTASMCGYTKQYATLEELYQTYKDQGLEIIGVPCGNFGGQEYETAEEIGQFIDKNYQVTFPLASKETVKKKDDQHPFFAWAAAIAKETEGISTPRWNFHKFIVDREGHLVKTYNSRTKPMGPTLIPYLEDLLSQEQ